MLEKFGIEAVYVIHAKKGYELHEKLVIELFKKTGIDFEFVTEGDPGSFTEELLNKYFCTGIRKMYPPGMISCVLNHILSYEKAAAGNNKYTLIFEDDPFFIGNFIEQIEAVIKEADALSPGFMISLENTTLRFPSTKKIRKGKLLYEENTGRCAGAYLVDRKGIQNILTDLQANKCEEVIDFWHNTLIRRKVVKMYWAYPALTEQGSHNGFLSSTNSTKGTSMTRRLRWLAQKFYKTHIVRRFR